MASTKGQPSPIKNNQAPPAVKEFFADRKAKFEEMQQKEAEQPKKPVQPYGRTPSFFEERFAELQKGNDSFS